MSRPTTQTGVPVPASTSDAPVRQAITFVGLTFAVSLAVYLPIIASARGWIPIAVPPALSALGVFGPAVAALLLLVHERARAGVETLVRDATAWRFGARWWVAALALPPALLGAMYAGYRLVGGPHRTASMVGVLSETGSGALVVLPVFVLVTVALAYGEEAGWRGYLLPRLQTRWSALTASLLLGIVWFLWHVPLLFLPGDMNRAMPIGLLAAFVLASAVLYTWLYNNTGGSVLAVTLLHGGFNVWGQFIAVHPAETGDPLSGAVMVGVVTFVAVVLVAVDGASTLSRERAPNTAVSE
jgi:membrane protease YdiL (CAAX protease family)